ncbi:LANO_0F06876g1_1 [Lachancea nothofagi CBS 11611]|uniref:Protein-lysine N-methyltransferase EFM5 n=1 Tax=Lachancea nothofagi CBS 11611 TaxID=1266666 RepID=A0A1G4K8P5_9SACH|nr:LANO_0F06876g1_1 [Lachancea nothofagi CBS 11611]
MSESESEIELSLSAHALAALQEFKNEEEERENRFKQLYDEAQRKSELQKGMDLFKEDWQLSQFWYSDETADIYADAMLEGADENTVIVIISAPSVFAAISKRTASTLPTKHIHLFEYDTRFEVLAGSEHYHYYDYNEPLTFPDSLKGKVDRLVIDPPFLNEDCQSKFSITAKALQNPNKRAKTASGNFQHRTICSTGERMAGVLSELYPDCKLTDYYPNHAKGLSNEFRCYANFEWNEWKYI